MSSGEGNRPCRPEKETELPDDMDTLKGENLRLLDRILPFNEPISNGKGAK